MELVTSLLANAQLWGANFLVLIVLTALVTAFTARGGKNGLISLVVSLYLAYALYIVFPYADTLIALGTGTTAKALLSLGLFVGLGIIPFLFLQRATRASYGSLHIIPNILLSFLVAGFIVALLYHVFDISHIYSFPKPIDQLFAPKGYFFYWFIAPLVGLFFLIR